MKILLFTLCLFIPFLSFSQVEVNAAGNLKLNAINSDAGVTDLVGRQADGTLVTRNISTIPSNLSVLNEDATNNRVGIRNANPEFTLDVLHANGSPSAGSADPHNGLNIRHEGSNNQQWTLYVSNTSGTLSFYDNGIKEIEFTADGSVNMLSDKNAKKNIDKLGIGLDQIMQLTPSQYKYKESQTGKLCYGFIAQDLNEILPELVAVSNESDIETYAVDYIGLIPVLTKSIQQQQEMINQQSIGIEKLKKLVETLILNK